MANADERLDEIARAGGRLLRVEREPADGGGSRALRLWFDVGGVELRAGDVGAIAADPVAPGAARLPLDAAEEDPWWALMGDPLARVSVRDDGSLLVQFRADDASPRILVLSAGDTGLRVRPLV